MKVCNKCNTSKELTKFTKKGKTLQAYCNSCLYTYQINRWKERKAKAVAYKGGKCSICGYSKTLAALEFHHIEPKTKLFAWNKLRLRPWHEVINELDKCTLMCSNCHAELHN